MDKHPKLYARPARRHEQAHQMWPILVGRVAFEVVGCLKQPGVITYGELASAMGYDAKAGVTLSSPLWLISRYCAEAGLPHLNAIVVGQASGEPGDEIPTVPGVTNAQMRRRVLDHGRKWFDYQQPTLDDFRDLQAGT